MCMNQGFRTSIRAAVLVTALAGVTIGVAACAKKPAGATPMPGMTYDSLKSLPDFSGWWYWDARPDEVLPSPAQVPLRPQAAAFFKDLLAKINAGKLPDLGAGEKNAYCRPPHFLGRNGGLGDEVEFLFTPGRVTVTDEGGLIRRIYLSARPLPPDLEETNSGTSIGHWEGRTLVVETGGLDSQARFIGPFSIGHNARVIERISLKAPDELEIVMRMTAPEVLSAPWEVKSRYRRDRTRVFHEAVDCVEDDRSIDPKTGRQRFDLTPPKDLPPPPRE
jgi:hypothetical protein